MKLFAGLIDHNDFIYLAVVNSFGSVVAKNKFPQQNADYSSLCTLLLSIQKAYACTSVKVSVKTLGPLPLIPDSPKHNEQLLDCLKNNLLPAMSLKPDAFRQADFFDREDDYYASYDPFEDAIKFALMGSLLSHNET